MKLKYYLRGLGMGILFATIIMAISSALHKNDISDEEIIKRAQKLGMIMTESTDKEGGLWGDTEDSQTEDVTENTQEESTQQKPSSEQQVPQNTQLQSEKPSESEQASEKESEKKPEKDSQKESEKDSEKKKPTKNEKKDYVQIKISDSDAARHVSEKLEFGGLVKSASDFLSYLRKHGYSTRILSGTFNIPVGASYEEICEIIIR